ncbi:TraB/GumN family protein [Methylobacterium sp. JK268]
MSATEAARRPGRRSPGGTAGPALLAALLALAAVPAGAACGGSDLLPRIREEAPAAWSRIAEGSGAPHGAGLLFRVSKRGLRDSFVFGTLHVRDRRATRFPRAVLRALSASRVLVTETVDQVASLRGTALAEFRRTIAARPDQAADALLPEADLARLKRLMGEHGFAPDDTGRLKPSVLALMLDLPPCAAGAPGAGTPLVDAALVRIARRRGLAVVGLESLSEQIAILDPLSAEEQRRLLLALVGLSGYAEDILETSVRRYVEKEPGRLLAWMRSPEMVPRIDAPPIPDRFLDLLLDQRSRRMHDRLGSLLRQGGVFIAVGAAHLPGTTGLLELLARDQFRVTRLD